MIAGCYDLHLYCDGVECERNRFRERAQGEFTGDDTGAAARARARRAGWKLFRDQRCLCPGCMKAGAKLAPVDDEPSGLTKVTAADIKRGGLAAYAVHVEHSAPRLRAIDLDCPGGHAKAGTVCNGYGVGVDLCYPRITAARRANRTARLRRASPQG